MSVLRFLHAADLHLDSPLRGLKRYPHMPHDEIGQATRRALDKLVETALAQNVAFVILAGDLYDGAWKGAATGLYMAAALGRLTRAGIDIVTVSGNHDADSVIARRLPLPEGVYSFPSDRPATHKLEKWRVALHGQSFADRHVPHDMTRDFPPPVPGWLNIGVLHTSLTGSKDHATYAPCTVEGLCAKGYDYWALGHVHKFAIVHENPWIVYPGVLQGRHARETGPCGGVIVEAQDGRIISVERAYFDSVRWAEVRINLEDISDGRGFAGRARAEFEKAMRLADGRLLVARVILEGATPLHGKLGGWEEDLRAVAAALGDRLALEKLRDETRPPPKAENDAFSETPAMTGLDEKLSPLLSDAATREELLRGLEDFFHLFPADLAAPLKTDDALLEKAALRLKARLFEQAAAERQGGSET